MLPQYLSECLDLRKWSIMMYNSKYFLSDASLGIYLDFLTTADPPLLKIAGFYTLYHI
jgi:hypothetical protein